MNQDYINVEGLQIYAYHGVFEEEKQKGQTFLINAKVYYDMSAPAQEDQIQEALNYADLCAFMDAFLRREHFDLIEAAADAVANAVLLHFAQATRIVLCLRKPSAPIGLPFEDVSVTVERGWHRVFLAIGSNMGDRRAYLDSVQEALKVPQVRGVRVSGYIETEPYGGVEQDRFLNGAIELWTTDSPKELLERCHAIEQAAHRTREIHWGPRTLDVDILFYDSLIYDDSDLIIPHIDIKNRDFVLRPMTELAPGFVHPVYHKTMRDLLEELE